MSVLINRLLILAALAGLCGWLCLTDDLQLQSLFICVTAAFCFSIGQILVSFRTPRTDVQST